LKSLQAAVARIVTDSRQPGEPKDPHASHLLPIYKAFANPSQVQSFVADLEQGLGWGEAKQRLVAQVEQELAPMREVYARLMANPDQIEDALSVGARKARAQAQPLMEKLREAVGLRNTRAVAQPQKAARKKTARFVTYRDETSQFRFKLVSAVGQELAISLPHADPKQAGAAMRDLQQRAADVVVQGDGELGYALLLDNQVLAQGLAQSAAQRDEGISLTQAALAEWVE
jgi:tryptophanyl-tRNA synthetase